MCRLDDLTIIVGMVTENEGVLMFLEHCLKSSQQLVINVLFAVC